jgi:putative salt-induced outer membrane protein YdiY
VLSRGNADRDAAHADLLVQRDTGANRATLDLGYQGSRESDEGVAITTRRRVFGGLKFDHYATERLYGYASSRGERDGVNHIDLRLTSGLGAGYDWWKTPDFELATEAGLAWVSEFYSDETDDDGYPAANVLWRLRRKLYEPFTFFHRGSWVPSLVESDNHLIDTETGLRVPITSALFLEGKLRFRWDSEPAEDAERSDYDWLLDLGYGF